MNKIISKDGTAIVYERSGEGPAIIPLQPVVWANAKTGAASGATDLTKGISLRKRFILLHTPGMM